MEGQKYESSVEAISAPIVQVYRVLSNLKNLERVRHLIPQDKIQELDISSDAVYLKVDGLGQKIVFRIVDQIENDTIKFGVDNLPLQMNLWIQLKSVAPCDTRIKVTLKADLPMMFRMMLDKKIQKGIDDAAVMLTQFPYSQWQ